MQPGIQDSTSVVGHDITLQVSTLTVGNFRKTNTIVTGPRTNNHLEGYHSGLKKSLKAAHPNIFCFIDKIKKEQKKNEVKLGQALSGVQVSNLDIGNH